MLASFLVWGCFLLWFACICYDLCLAFGVVVVVVGCINRCLGFRFGLGDLGWCSFGGFGFYWLGLLWVCVVIGSWFVLR